METCIIVALGCFFLAGMAVGLLTLAFLYMLKAP